MEREITPKTVTLDWLDYVMLKTRESSNFKLDSTILKEIIIELINSRHSEVILKKEGQNDFEIIVRQIIPLNPTAVPTMKLFKVDKLLLK